MAGVMASAHLRSGGRQGSAIADDFIAFGAAIESWRQPMLDIARVVATQVESDLRVFAAAFDGGKFASPQTS